MSDQTHLTHFSGDKKAWPVYITLGNLPSGQRNSPTSLGVLLLASLPIPPKLSRFSKAHQHQRQINTDTLRAGLELIFAPLQDPAHDGIPIDCANGKVRRCFPNLALWIADHIKCVALHGIKSNVCPRCELPALALGTNMKVSPVTDYAIYHHYDYISKNNSLRPVRPVRQTQPTHRTSIANQDAPGAHPILGTHRARTQNAGRTGRTPNTQDTTRRSTQSSGRHQTQHPILRTQSEAAPNPQDATRRRPYSS